MDFNLKKMQEKSKNTLLILILIALLLSLVVYVGISRYNKHKEKLELKAYEQGMMDIIADMYETANKCHVFALNPEEGKHVKVISVDCLEKEGEE